MKDQPYQFISNMDAFRADAKPLHFNAIEQAMAQEREDRKERKSATHITCDDYTGIHAVVEYNTEYDAFSFLADGKLRHVGAMFCQPVDVIAVNIRSTDCDGLDADNVYEVSLMDCGVESFIDSYIEGADGAMSVYRMNQEEYDGYAKASDDAAYRAHMLQTGF